MEPNIEQYGDLPKPLGTFNIDCKEMMFYQYLPIKFSGGEVLYYEKRLNCFSNMMNLCAEVFVLLHGRKEYINSYVYLTAKHMYQPAGTSFNRKGYHTDGFGTKDINFIWCDKYPTVFNTTAFQLSNDDEVSMKQMEEQALRVNEFQYPENTLLCLNQFNVHKVAEIEVGCFRTFFKMSFSRDIYDLIGNSHNYEMHYNWEMKPRKEQRNIPQTSKP